jgi:hypothetical protein
MTYGVTGCRRSLLSWGRRRHQAEHSRHGEKQYPHENLPPNARQDKCGGMLDLPLKSIHLSFARHRQGEPDQSREQFDPRSAPGWLRANRRIKIGPTAAC